MSDATSEHGAERGDEKGYRDGARRACAPEQTLRRIKPLLPVFGITRLANLTGLDRIGIPVFQSCRPNARSLSVYQGKGITDDAARVSAAMEAIETHCAERVLAPLKLASFEELRYSHRLVDVDRLPLSDPAGLDADLPFLWIEGDDLLGSSGRWMPFEMVHANYALPEPQNSGVLAATTNGLASGNTRDEALLHALLEVIERDAETLWKLGADAWSNRTAVRLDSVEDPHCQLLLRMFDDAGIRVAVWETTSDLGVPCFSALIDDATGETGAPEFGAGAHLAPEVALSRALTEAAQARLTFIAGAREDIPDADYAPEVLAERRAGADQIFDDLAPERYFAASASLETASLSDDVEIVLERLITSGIDQVMAADLSMSGIAVPVVRVVVPGLEAAFEGPGSDYVPGERAARVLGNAT